MASTYCDETDVGSRLGLDSAQRTRAENRITSCIRRATIEIDQMFRDYGRDVPSDHIAESTLNGAIAAGATSIVLNDASDFSSAGNGNIKGDSFAWTSKTSNTLNGVTGVTFDHTNNSKVQEGEFAHVLKEICADLAAAIYMEDEGLFQGNETSKTRGEIVRDRAMSSLRRLAHLGSVD